MFDFAWSEIALIAAVALIAIGPKDMPVAIRTVAGLVKKARRMAAEFQTHIDEMVREANLDEVKNSINEIRNFDFKGEIERHIDPDNTLRDTFASDPFAAVPSEPAPLETVEVSETVAVEPEPVPEPEEPTAPAFIPPNMVPPREPITAALDLEPPAFVPPEYAQRSRST